MILNNIIGWLKGESRGLLKRIPNPRDLNLKELLLGEYKPIAARKTLAPLFEENQLRQSDCSFEAWSRAYSVYFGEHISQRYLRAKAYQQGLANLQGEANIEAGAKIGRKFGVVLESDLLSDETLAPEDYVNIDFVKYDALASTRKIGSYAFIHSFVEYLQAIDIGYAVVLGRTWYLPVPFQAPWIVGRSGQYIGPHATAGVGYDLQYQGQQMIIGKNSWGDAWGNKGLYYTSLIDIQTDINIYSAIAITPIPYTPKDVKITTIKSLLLDLMKKLKMFNLEQQLYDTAKSLLGKNLAPSLQPLACAQSVCVIVNEAFGEKNNWTSTDDIYNALKDNPKWESISEPEKGAIIVSPTGQIPSDSNLPILSDGKRHAHCGIIGQFLSEDNSLWIMSNDSEKKEWLANWTYQRWHDYFVIYGKVPTFMFRRIA